MDSEIRAIYRRMSESDRQRVDAIADGDFKRLTIRLWDAAHRAGGRAPDPAKLAERAEAKQDELDEALVKNALAGQYGKRSEDAVRACMEQHTNNSTQRKFLRAARIAVVAARKN